MMNKSSWKGGKLKREKMMKIKELSYVEASGSVPEAFKSAFLKRGDIVYLPEGELPKLTKISTEEALEKIGEIVQEACKASGKRLYSYPGANPGRSLRKGVVVCKWGIGRGESHTLFRASWRELFSKFFSSGLLQCCIIRKGKKDEASGRYFYSAMGFFREGALTD